MPAALRLTWIPGQLQHPTPAQPAGALCKAQLPHFCPVSEHLKALAARNIRVLPALCAPSRAHSNGPLSHSTESALCRQRYVWLLARNPALSTP